VGVGLPCKFPLRGSHFITSVVSPSRGTWQFCPQVVVYLQRTAHNFARILLGARMIEWLVVPKKYRYAYSIE